MLRAIKWLLPIFLLNVKLSQSIAQQVTFELPDNQVFCFHEQYDVTRVYEMTYSVLSGGKNDVDCKVLSPAGLVIYKKTLSKGDQFKFQSSHGEFSFCFSNEFSSFTHKVVRFEIRDDSIRDELVDRPSANTYAETLLQNMKIALNKVEDFQNQYRVGEIRGRFWAEKLNERVQWWSVVHAAVVVLSALGQVLVLRAFFTERRVTSSADRKGWTLASHYNGVHLGISDLDTAAPFVY
jgi:hypothetical protein